jgi:hypothetical protein
MAISRMQQPRQQYGLGSIVKSVKKGVKGLAKGAKKVLKSDAGKLGLLALGTYGLGGGKFFGGKTLPFLKAKGGFSLGNLGTNLGLNSLFSKSTGDNAALKNFGKVFLGGAALGGAKFLGGKGIFAGGQGLGRFANLKNLPGAIGSSLFSKSTGDNAELKNFGKVFLGGAALAGGLAALSGEDEEVQEVVGQDVPSLQNYLTSYYQNLGYTADQIAENVARDTAEYTSGAGGYAEGGRIGYSDGTEFEKYLEGREKFNKEQNFIKSF